MTVREFSIPGQNRYRISGEGYSTQGILEHTSGVAAGQPWKKGTPAYSTQGQLLSTGGTRIDLDPFLLPMALCSDARLDGEALIGDPTEGALIVLAEKGGQRGRRSSDVPARGRSAFRLRLQVHGYVPQHEERAGQVGGALFRQGSAGCADRACRLVLACQVVRIILSPRRIATWRSRKTTAWPKRV